MGTDQTVTVSEADAATRERTPIHTIRVIHRAKRSRAVQVARLGRRPLVLGREPPTGGLQLADERTSRQHAIIRRSRNGALFVIEDNHSKNGLHVNGETVLARALEPEDVIRIGGVLLVHEVGPEPGAPPQRAHDSIGLLGESRKMSSLRAALARLAPGRVPVLLLGETGVGKELAARGLHALSGRGGALRAVNCAAIPDTLVEATLFGQLRGSFTGAEAGRPGVFREAHRGTVFLDEVAELSPRAQAALLRVLDDGVVRPVGAASGLATDVRVVAATNRDLAAAVERGAFRRDLYARLAGAVLTIPPLRERRADVLPIASAVLGAARSLNPAAAEALTIAPWPMNVRGLRAVVERLRVELPPDTQVGLEHLPEDLAAPIRTRQTAAPSAVAASRRPAREELVRALTLFDGNVTRVAGHFGRSRQQLYRWIRQDGITPDRYRQDADPSHEAQ